MKQLKGPLTFVLIYITGLFIADSLTASGSVIFFAGGITTIIASAVSDFIEKE